MSDTAPAATNEKMENHFFRASAEDFKKIPGSPIAYWVGIKIITAFNQPKLGEKFLVKSGLTSGDKQRFVRNWAECDYQKINFKAENNKFNELKWFPHNDGVGIRKWYGNRSNVINWESNGSDIIQYENSTIRNSQFYFKMGVTWSDISTSFFAARFLPNGSIFENTGSLIIVDDLDFQPILAYLCTKIAKMFLEIMNPTLHYGVGEIAKLPLLNIEAPLLIIDVAITALNKSKSDWNSYETSWDFTTLPMLHPDHRHPTLEQTYADLRARWQNTTLEMQRLEEENNRIFIEAYGLQDELTRDVPLEEITLTCNPRYRFGKGKTDDDYETLLRCDTVKELISYAVGCMMGRYSLDEPGLVYAHSGNHGFDPNRFRTFPADEDGILPVMDLDWFDDDAARRLSAFIQFVWPETHLDDNLSFIADCLTPRAAESPLDTIRRYLSTTFFKDHMRTYKKRPIYWLFSSGRQKAFTCLVYLHRYHPATLSRMRSNYVTPLQGKLAARMEFLDHERQAAGTPSAQKKIQTQMDLLKKKQTELNTFDDELRHYADLKIDLDLDDGVKVNYAKFGNLLAERKGITGK